MEADVINGNAVKVTPPKKELVYIEDEVSATSFVENVYACVHMITNKSTHPLPLVGQLFRSSVIQEYTLREVAAHHDASSCWMVIADNVYDVTEFISEHPGSEEIMLEHAGADATVAFESKGHSKYAEELLAKYCIGVLNPEERRIKP